MSYDDEYHCPNCGAVLNNQDGFSPYDGTWTCTECYQRLMDDEIYDGDTFTGVEWRCDCCNALLNKQFCFSDSFGSWTCTECGHKNSITEYDINNDSSGKGFGILLGAGCFFFIAKGICKLWTWVKSKVKKTPKGKSWFLLLICLLFGIFGIHKFIEKEIGMGFLYLFTLGLFGVGWIIDIVKYIKRIPH